MAVRIIRRWTSPRPSDAQVAVDTALRFLAQRPRSEREVRQRLRRAGVDESAIDAVIVQLERQRLLDDTEFARYWVEQRQEFRPRGARLLRAELRQRGVEAATAELAARTVDASAEDDAYRAAEKRAFRLGVTDERAFKSRMSQFLVRRGFDWDTVASVVARLWRDVNTS